MREAESVGNAVAALAGLLARQGDAVLKAEDQLQNTKKMLEAERQSVLRQQQV